MANLTKRQAELAAIRKNGKATDISRKEIPKCEWPDPNCQALAAYKVQFLIREEGRFSKPMCFCAEHFFDYQVEELDVRKVARA